MGMLDGLVGQLAQSAGNQTGQAGGLGGLLGGILGGGSQEQEGGAPAGLSALLLPAVLGWVQQQGGVGNVVSSLTNSGLGSQVQSWVSNGENQEIGSQAISQVLSSDQVTQLAAKMGLSPEQVQSGMAALLPQVINHLTPSGDASNPEESNGLLNAALGKLGGMFG